MIKNVSTGIKSETSEFLRIKATTCGNIVRDRFRAVHMIPKAVAFKLGSTKFGTSAQIATGNSPYPMPNKTIGKDKR